MASQARAVPHSAPVADPWAAIHDRATPLVLEPAAPPQAPWVDALLAQAPFAWRAEGPADAVAAMLTDAPRRFKRWCPSMQSALPS